MVGFPNATTCALLHLVIFFYLATPAISLSFNYSTFSKADQKDIKIEGDASFNGDTSTGDIDMSANMYGSICRASYNAQPVQLWDKATGQVASFTTRFEFLMYASNNGKEVMEAEEYYTDSQGESEPMTEIEMGTAPRRFPYHELVEATRNFAAEEKLGQGGFGTVYQGYLREPAGLAVAIKRLQSSIQGKKEYKSEIKVISRLRHRNLVRLIGWCHGHDQALLLVYELMPNRRLDIHLHGKKGTFLTWEMRMKILLELGSALLYLHEEWEQCVLHRDIKPSNVMLDESFGAKLGDFGLARLVDHAAGMQTMTAISGTPGYLDPDCVNTGKASAESDVYSFGVVLLEVACGRRPMSITAADQDKQKSGGVFRLVEWAWGLYGQGMILEAADERLNGDYNAAEVERVMVVGLWCAHPNPSVRPSIWTAMATLQPKVDQAYQLPVLPSKMPVPMDSIPISIQLWNKPKNEDPEGFEELELDHHTGHSASSFASSGASEQSASSATAEDKRRRSGSSGASEHAASFSASLYDWEAILEATDKKLEADYNTVEMEEYGREAILEAADKKLNGDYNTTEVEGIAMEKFKATLCYLRGKP
uniref:Uncharacterized protein n=1 Tax=Aegilops tauschii TaxID=37682 RepID=M8CRN8_AEGTA